MPESRMAANMPAHMAEIVVWRKGMDNPIQLPISNDDARAFIDRVREDGLDVDESYAFDTLIDPNGRKMFVVLTQIQAIVVNVSTGIVPAHSSPLIN